MATKSKRIDVDTGWIVLACAGSLGARAFREFLPMAEETGDDVVKLRHSPHVVALRTVSGPGLSGTHPIRIIRDEAGRAVEAVIRLISDEAEETK